MTVSRIDADGPESASPVGGAASPHAWAKPTPRSVVFGLLGDYVRYYFDGTVRLLAMIELLGFFGISEPTTRVLMSRLRREGWFDARRVGRQSIYRVNDRCLQMLEDGRTRIFHRDRSAWDGRWYMAIYVVPESDRGARDRLRKAAAWLGFGPLASSTWISPHNRLDTIAQALEDEPNVRLDLLTASTGSISTDREMATRCWDLAALNRDYGRLLDMIRHRLPDYQAGRLSPRDALVERTQLVHEYRLLPFRDPDLPLELLPSGWVGHEAHVAFLEAYQALRAPAEQAYLAVARASGHGTAAASSDRA